MCIHRESGQVEAGLTQIIKWTTEGVVKGIVYPAFQGGFLGAEGDTGYVPSILRRQVHVSYRGYYNVCQ